MSITTRHLRQLLARHEISEAWQMRVVLGLPQLIPAKWAGMFKCITITDDHGRDVTYPPNFHNVDDYIKDLEKEDKKLGLPVGAWISEAKEWLRIHDKEWEGIGDDLVPLDGLTDVALASRQEARRNELIASAKSKISQEELDAIRGKYR